MELLEGGLGLGKEDWESFVVVVDDGTEVDVRDEKPRKRVGSPFQPNSVGFPCGTSGRIYNLFRP